MRAGAVEVLLDEDTLPGGKSVGLEDIGSFQACEEFDAGLGVVGVDCEVPGCGNAVAAHEFFGEILAAFESGAVGTRAEDCHAGAFQSLAQAFHQGVFRAYDHQIDGVVGHGSGNGGEIIGGKGQVGAVGSGSSVAGCDEKLAQTRAAGYSACESRFAASASEQ